MKGKTWFVALAVIGVGVMAGIFLLKPKSDSQAAAALVGKWVATDPANPTLHRHEEGVAREAIDVRADGTLTYVIQLRPSASAPTTQKQDSTETSIWGWQIRSGRLLLKDMGEGSTQEWMPPLKISVSSKSFSISRRKQGVKEFTKIGGNGTGP